MEPQVLIHGQGPVGMVCALALAAVGLRVALQGLEHGAPRAAGASAAPAPPDIRAFALNAASVALLQRLRVWDGLAASARTPVLDMRVYGDRPGAALHFSAWQHGQEALAHIVDAAALEAAVLQALRYAPGVSLRPPGAAAPTGVQLEIVAEGRDSASRRRLGVQMPLQAYGHHALAARLVCAQPHQGVAWQWFRGPDVLALLPMDADVEAGAAAGGAGHGFALVWSMPQAQAVELLKLPEPEFNTTLNDATQGLPGPLRLAGARASWPLHHGRAERVHGPGWVLVGDAAHALHPLAGQGLNLGLADVQALSHTLASRDTWRSLGDARVLARYARARATDTWAMGATTDGLQQLFAHTAPWVAATRHLGLRGLDMSLASPIKRALVRQAVGAR